MIMQSKTKRGYKKTDQTILLEIINKPKKSYSEAISLMKFNSIENDDFDQIQFYQDEEYDNEKPVSQNILTNEYSITQTPIDFSNYFQIDYDRINIYNLNDCFSGILHYIFYNSGNKLNTRELEFHFSNGKMRQNFTVLEKKSPINQYNILNIFDFENIDSQFIIDSCKNAFFGLTLLRIKVNPISYSIRSGRNFNNSLYLISFVFEAYDEYSCKWTVLDERVNINDVNRDGGFKMFPVRKTTKTYSKFRIRQIEPSANGNWGFSIAALEIHGVVFYRENIDQQNETDINYDTLNNDPYDPLEDISKYII